MANEKDWQAIAESIFGTELDRKIAKTYTDTFDKYLASIPKDELLKLYDVPLYGDYALGITGTPLLTNLQSEVAKLHNDVREKAEALRGQAADSQSKEKEIQELRETLVTLEAKQSLAHLLNRVRVDAQERLVTDPQFRAQFQNAAPCNAFVLSIDIRRSTELMLKARTPRLFAEFTITLANSLRQVILENYGVFDEFTGDGILAFFPEFFAGKDAGYRALHSAAECHRLFADYYRTSRSSFSSVLIDTGLGIGIDYGSAQIVEIGGEFTVVGEPVVYACRMANAEAGQTYLNQPAFDQLFPRYATFEFSETELLIKHEGRIVAYAVRPNGKIFTPATPEWLSAETVEGQAPTS